MPQGRTEPNRTSLIPQPRRLESAGGTVEVGQISVSAMDRFPLRYRGAISKLASTVGTGADGPTLSLTIKHVDTATEGYELAIATGQATIGANDDLGALHAVRTLVDLWDQSNGTSLPKIHISDSPTYANRGVFVESFAGTDRMQLSDWYTFLDRVGQLKFNTIGISIYGCWDIRHDNDRSEYIFVPLSDFPQLESQQRMVFWDPELGEQVEQRYLPAMFEANYFSEVVKYAHDHGIEVIPHFGGPGHSTLIPRLVPQLSALDDEGNPTGYGYCVSRPEAREELSKLVRCLIRDHLKPNGIKRLHVAGDEYYPISNVDPSDRSRTVSPYCRCPTCRKLTPGQMLGQYLSHVGRILDDNGISMLHWHDTLAREEVLDGYLDQILEARISKPALVWWKYNDPLPTPDSSRSVSWVAPTTGLFPNLFYQDFSSNIENMLRRGRSANAIGTLAYSMPDPANHFNFACLADLSWNLEGSGGASGFRRRWAHHITSGETDIAEQALSLASSITGCYPLMMYIVNQIMPYFSTSAGGATFYPDDLLRSFSVTQPPLEDLLKQIIATLQEAYLLMPGGRDVRNWPNPVSSWRDELSRIRLSIDLFLRVLDIARRSSTSKEESTVLTRKSEELLRLAHDSKPAFLAPAVLRELWGFIREIEATVARLRKNMELNQPQSWHAWII
ncbi:glycoside hydrolase family 20 zincin-like fold domain-containing protein [Saccharomonospora sp. NPDC046836]|uniref:glycoside hydrolase family 20 zincin-like fold domain-containing protein n=1 Tax=Saccharomonospora sp. NPDC046836 TaxID=3156921 RepID=UPI0033EEDD47